MRRVLRVKVRVKRRPLSGHASSGGPRLQLRRRQVSTALDLAEMQQAEVRGDEALLTCPSCRVTARVEGDEGAISCPYCGHGYHEDGAISLWRQPRGAGLQLPHISVAASGGPLHEPRGGRFGTMTMSRLQGKGVQVTRLSNMMLRPPSPTSALPPIHQGSDGAWSPRERSTVSARSLALLHPDSPPPSPRQHRAVALTREQFLQEVKRAHQTLNYQALQSFYARTFASHGELCLLIEDELAESGPVTREPAIKLDLLHAVNDALRGMPSTIHKTVLKAIINALLEERPLLEAREEARALFALLQCPVFAAQRSYTIFAHVLRRAATLPGTERALLPRWFRVLGSDRLRTLVRHIAQFVSLRQFPPSGKSLPPPAKSRWWIPAAARVMALINAANESASPPLVHFSELYNLALEHVDLLREYYVWQSSPHRFSFCQFPFMLSLAAKRYILTKDSEQQMILTARRSLAAKASRRLAPQIDIFFLNIRVRRAFIVSDSLNEIAHKQGELKKKLKVSFIGEPGLDMGGLTKEWFLLLVRHIFQPDYGMFVYHKHSRCYWFSTIAEESSEQQDLTLEGVRDLEEGGEVQEGGGLREYHLIGVLMGLAVYNSTILDLHFPAVCYRKLLSPPIPPAPGDESVLLGVVQHPSIDDLAEIMPDVAKGLSELLQYDGNVEEDMCMCFEVSLEEYGVIRTWPLKPGGGSLPVTNENRSEYVALYLDWVLNAAVYRQFRAFYLGFHSVCASNALIMLRPEEVELLVCGSPTIDLAEFRKITEYDGYRPDDKVICDLWEVLESFPLELQRKFLLFATGSDRVPVGGTGEMTFKVTRAAGSLQDLPEAHTCFNQLVLPPYSGVQQLRRKLTIAISNAEGFGLE